MPEEVLIAVAPYVGGLALVWQLLISGMEILRLVW
jgi:hypothetical protein